MSLSGVLQTGRSGMMSSKAGISTTGHNISNASNPEFSRQRVSVKAEASQQMAAQGGPYIGQGAKLSKISRVNDGYLERQVREGGRDVAHYEEKQTTLNQIEDVFNEMNGEGLNRLVTRFFNEFRKLSNEPSSEAIRQSVREASAAMVNDFHRLRKELESTRVHIDSRIEGGMRELNQMAKEMRDLNMRIHLSEIQGNEPNDLLDRRDEIAKKMMTYFDLATHKDDQGMMTIDVKGVGPLVTGPNVEEYHIARSPADPDTGKPEGALQITRSPFSHDNIASQFKGGKLGAMIEARDKHIGSLLERLDELAYSVTQSVNEIHKQGVTRDGGIGVDFFKPVDQVARAAEMVGLSSAIQDSAGNIATAVTPDAPGDNRLALAIANLQNARIMKDGKVGFDDFYNSMVADVGVASQRNTEALNQSKTILGQLNKVRESVSGVSIDEETTNLMQYQQQFNASARVIKVADEMLDTVLSLGRR